MAFPHSRETRWRNPSAPWTIKAPANLTRVSSEKPAVDCESVALQGIGGGEVRACVCVCVCVCVCARARGEHAHQCI